MKHNKHHLVGVAIASLFVLSSCGGGSSPSGNPRTPTLGGSPTPVSWIPGQFPAASTLKDYCAAPRSGVDSVTGEVFPDRSGTELQQKMWLRSWSNDTYLWFDEIDDNDPNNFSVAAFFDQLKTNERTPSGALKDNFHFSQSTEEYNRESIGGSRSGYGISWEFVSASPPRQLIVRYTEPNSPARLSNIKRGYELVEINGIDFINSSSQQDVNAINEAVFPNDSNNTNQFVFRDLNAPEGELIMTDLTSASVDIAPVQNVKIIDTNRGKLGYMQFNTFIRAGQTGLIDAFQQFNNESVTNLVVDLRYNGGGALAMASQLAYMVAGPSQTNGLTFETTQFNAKSGNTNPVTGERTSPTPFYNREIDFDNGVFTNRVLPSVEVTRVYVLTTGRTCSASEAFMNGLRGIDVEVIQIGDRTCGKPYGFYPTDNCGTTYFTIQFQGVNNKGFGEYSDGFVPTNNPIFDTDIKGCPALDDFSHALGDEDETLLRTAVNYIENGTCPPVDASANAFAKSMIKQSAVSLDSALVSDKAAIRTPNTYLNAIIQENKIYTPAPREQK